SIGKGQDSDRNLACRLQLPHDLARIGNSLTDAQFLLIHRAPMKFTSVSVLATGIALSVLSSGLVTRAGASEFRVFPSGNSSSSERPCVVADLSGAAFSLPYPCRRAEDDKPEGVCTAVVSLPSASNGSRVEGDCGNRTARLEVAWADGRLRLEMRFRERVFDNVWTQVSPATVTYSFVSDLRLLADLRDPVFANASIVKGESPIVEYWLPRAERTLLLFAAPVRNAFVCNSPEEIRLRWRRLGADLKSAPGEGALVHFPAVRLETALSESDGREKAHDGAFLCEADSRRHRTGIVALAIAGVIGVSMVIIVAGYLVTRLGKATRYSNME
uniref:Ig-like domain-containing protein n=2 Tax=Macrostomum lignano TaxID=282301 RepID=A0A1I8HE12_9PLAT